LAKSKQAEETLRDASNCNIPDENRKKLFGLGPESRQKESARKTPLFRIRERFVYVYSSMAKPQLTGND